MTTTVAKLIDPENENAEGKCIHPQALTTVRERGGRWAAYQNHDLGSKTLGHLKLLKFGDGCTFAEPPAHYPDPSISQGHNYLYVGELNLTNGVIT
jgi:hypothetical protein